VLRGFFLLGFRTRITFFLRYAALPDKQKRRENPRLDNP
jgi:hypothetical protein